MTTTDPAAETVTGELVDSPATDLAVVDDTRAAIDRAAEHAIANPGVPGADEFLALAAQARILSMSGAAPKPVQDDPYVAFHLALVGRDFGLSPSAAMTMIDIIQGRWDDRRKRYDYTFSLSPQLMNAQIRRLGLGSIVPAVREVDRAVAVVLAPGGRLDPRCSRSWPDHVADCGCDGIVGDSEFTWDDARLAGLVGGKCRPGEHHKETRTRSNGGTYQACGCNQGYITYPKRMMWWRAAGFAADDWLPEAGLGMYTAEALGAPVDENGRMIDVASVELPDGYDPDQPPVVEDPVADESVRAAVQERIDALNDDARAALRVLWKGGEDGSGQVLFPPAELHVSEIPVAEALIASIEARAAAGEFTSTGDDVLDGVVASVRAMTPAQVAGALQVRQIPVEGNMDHQRKILAQRLYEEATSEPFDETAAADTAGDPQEAPTEPHSTDGGDPEGPTIDGLRAALEALDKRQVVAVAHRFFVGTAGTKAELVDRLVAELPETSWEPGTRLLPTAE